jgi:hypothetical protein
VSHAFIKIIRTPHKMYLMNEKKDGKRNKRDEDTVTVGK